jgi:hypothetical protein
MGHDYPVHDRVEDFAVPRERFPRSASDLAARD